MFFITPEGQASKIKFNSDGTSTLSCKTNGNDIEVYFFLKGDAK
jgi:hypothetical protein